MAERSRGGHMSGDAVVGPVKAPRGPAPGAQSRRAPTLEEMEARLPDVSVQVAKLAVKVQQASRAEKAAEENWHLARGDTYDQEQEFEKAVREYENLRDSIDRAREEQQR